MFNNPRRPSLQLGISLLEVLLSLSIIAIILVMATRYFFAASNNNKINTTISQIGGLIAAVHSWKGASPEYTDLSIQSLAIAGQLVNFPGFNNKSYNPTLTTMWGKRFSIQPSKSTGQALITVELPTSATCHSIIRAYPSDNTGNITATCHASTFAYEFP